MDKNDSSAARPVRGLSLERKLPLLLGILISVLVVAAVVGAYLEVRRSALETTHSRLQTVDTWMQDLLATQLQARFTSLGNLADTSQTLRRALDGEVEDSAAVARLLDRLRTNNDSTLPIELWNARGERILVAGDTGTVEGRPQPTETAYGDTLPRVGPLFRRDSSVYYEYQIPVTDGERVLGLIRQTRRLSGSETARSIQNVLQVGTIYLANRDADVWLTIGGRIVDPAPLGVMDGVHTAERDGVKVLRHATHIPGSPWAAVIETPVDVALEGPSRFLRRAAALSLLLWLAGVALAWAISRRITKPVRALDAAAVAFSHGEYDKRVGVESGDEVGRLAQTFNVMAERVQEAHSELALRYDEAQGMAAELEMSNEQLMDAVEVAEEARAQAQKANQTKSDFLATMSHEIRTPINAMIGYTDLLEMGVPGSLTDQQTRFINRIRESGRHLVSLVDELLDFAKIESNEMRMEDAAFSARSAAENAVAALASAAHRKGVILTHDCSDDYAFRGDARRVHQIVLNLLNNAVKFTDAGGAVSVHCGRAAAPEAMDADEAVFIEVADTGIGIPEQELERIFQPFVQVTGGYTRQHGGAGLGLAISQKLAHLMGGVVTVRSDPGEGAVFTLWLHPATSPFKAA